MNYKHKNPSHSFSIRAKGIASMLVMDIAVTPYGNPALLYKTKGIWDTGATKSVITQQLFDALHLVPFGMSKVSTASESGILKQTYLVDVFLKQDVVVQQIEVTVGTIASEVGIDFLIGMDIITTGDFSITNFEGNTIMSFRIPSLYQVDFVEQHNKEKEFIDRHLAAKRNMNSPCICNSGKKFKNCHGKNLIEDK